MKNMKNVLYTSIFVLLLSSVATSFGMKPSRRSASDALGKQENNKRQKLDLVVPATLVQIKPRGSRNVRDVLAAATIASSLDQNYQNQSHNGTQANSDVIKRVITYKEWPQEIK